MMKSFRIILLFCSVFILTGLACQFAISSDPTARAVSTNINEETPTGESIVPTTAPLDDHLPPTTPTIPEVLPSPTKESLVNGKLQAITLENIQNLERIGEMPYPQIKPNHLIYILKFSHDGTKLAIKSQNWENHDQAIIVWDLINNTRLLEIDDRNFILDQIYFSPGDDQLWGFRQGFFDRYDLEDGTLVNSAVIPEYSGSAVAVSPDGKIMVAGVYDNVTQISTVHFYELGNLESNFSDVMAYMVMDFQFSPDNTMVAGTSAQIGSTVTKIWDRETGTLLKDFYNYDYGPTFSPNSTLAAFVKGNQFSIFSTDSWALKKTFQNDNLTSTNFPIFFLGNNQVLAVQETVSLSFIDMNSGKELLELPERVTIADYAPSVNIIISNVNEKNIEIWGIR